MTRGIEQGPASPQETQLSEKPTTIILKRISFDARLFNHPDGGSKMMQVIDDAFNAHHRLANGLK